MGLGIGRGERCRRLGVAVAAWTYMPTVRVLASPFSFTGGGKLTCSYEFSVVVTPICSSIYIIYIKDEENRASTTAHATGHCSYEFPVVVTPICSSIYIIYIKDEENRASTTAHATCHSTSG
jgi:hypothetical protein